MSMRGSRNFHRGVGGGGPGQSDKKSSDHVFLVLSLSYRSQMINFKENYHFSFEGSPTFSRGVQLFPGGGGGGGGGSIAYAL